MLLSYAAFRPPGGGAVKDGTREGWMNADASRFVYKNADDNNMPQLVLLEVDPTSLGAAPALSAPTFAPTPVTVPGLDTAVATVAVSGTGVLRVAVAFFSAGLPDVIDRGNGVVLGDKGMNGDVVSGDGVFSGRGYYGY